MVFKTAQKQNDKLIADLIIAKLFLKRTKCFMTSIHDVNLLYAAEYVVFLLPNSFLKRNINEHVSLSV